MFNNFSSDLLWNPSYSCGIMFVDCQKLLVRVHFTVYHLIVHIHIYLRITFSLAYETQIKRGWSKPPMKYLVAHPHFQSIFFLQ